VILLSNFPGARLSGLFSGGDYPFIQRPIVSSDLGYNFPDIVQVDDYEGHVTPAEELVKYADIGMPNKVKGVWHHQLHPEADVNPCPTQPKGLNMLKDLQLLQNKQTNINLRGTFLGQSVAVLTLSCKRMLPGGDGVPNAEGMTRLTPAAAAAANRERWTPRLSAEMALMSTSAPARTI
jgi:hypothetical protein